MARRTANTYFQAATVPLQRSLVALKFRSLKATWRSGYATVCKTVYPGSIPGVASSKNLKDLGPISGPNFNPKFWRWDPPVTYGPSCPEKWRLAAF